MRLKGGPELRARLAAIAASKPELGRAWAEDAATRIRADAPTRSGALQRSVKAGEKAGKAAVLGLFYGRILDSGTKAYKVVPKGAALKFQYRGRTIFAKQANRRRLRRRPFITRNSQLALQSPMLARVIAQAWSRKGGGRFGRL